MKTLSRLLALSFLLAGVARADVPPPDMEPCMSKPVGAACLYQGATGICESSTCTRLDYSKWDRDASAAPPTTTYACVLCKSKAATETTTATTTNTTTATPSATSTTTSTSTDSTEKKDGGCQLGGLSAKRVAPWLLAGSFSLLFLFARRRRSR